jgi:PKD repeat protein
MYGWGLLDVKASAELILEENGSSKIIRESILGQGGTFEYEFLSDGITPIKATLAWTDPAGTPVGVSVNPTNLMLVNDLDLRIFDEDGVEYFPWTLNPSLGAGAQGIQSADNFRDNVEQVLINSVKPKKYLVRIRHKGELAFGMQPFSLVFTAGTLDGAAETLYWIGGANGVWNDQKNWSLTANGPAAGIIPSEKTRVVFDGNSGQAIAVNLSGSAQAFSVNMFGNQLLTLDLNAKDILVSNGFRISNQLTEIKNGNIIFDSKSSNELLVEFGQTLLDNVGIHFSDGNWKVISGSKFDDVLIGESKVTFDLPTFQLNKLEVAAAGVLAGNFDILKFAESIKIATSAQIKSNVTVQFVGESGQFNNPSNSAFTNLEVLSGTLSLISDGIENLKISNGKALLSIPSLSVAKLELGPKSVFEFGQVGNLTVTGDILSTATQEAKALITASASGSGFIYDVYRKFCFDHINVTNVNKTGRGIINLGTAAAVQNASGWLKQICQEVLFAKFKSSFLCVGAAVTFENESEGSVSSYRWEFGTSGTSSLKDPIFVFETPGNYLIKLTISNSQGSTTFQQEIKIGANELAKPKIVINGSQLTSQEPGTSYQWYLNGQVIAGATQRSFVVEKDGSYQVAIFNAVCNRVSDPVVVSSLPEPDLSRFGIAVGPIPTTDQITVRITNEYKGPITFTMSDMAGRVYSTRLAGKNSEQLDEVLSLPARKGIYILKIETNSLTVYKKVIKQ